MPKIVLGKSHKITHKQHPLNPHEKLPQYFRNASTTKPTKPDYPMTISDMRSWTQRFSTNHKNNKILYYALGFIRQIIPTALYRRQLKAKLAAIANHDTAYIAGRVNYYNKLTNYCILPSQTPTLKNLKLQKKGKVYYFDTFEFTRYFDSRMKLATVFGDVTRTPNLPSVVKSRPISGNNANAVLLKLNKIRHFVFVDDKKPFTSKKNLLVGRSHVKQPHRVRFLEMYFGHPMCNVGQVNKCKNNPAWVVERMTIQEQLDYKFILCIEGYDVASNLKWVMSSNSIAVMPKPKYETWFMEGTLLPDVHYIAIDDDYSNLEEKLNHYIGNPADAQKIIANAHRHVEQFKNNEREELISLMVLDKYFSATAQKAPAAVAVRPATPAKGVMTGRTGLANPQGLVPA